MYGARQYYIQALLDPMQECIVGKSSQNLPKFFWSRTSADFGYSYRTMYYSLSSQAQQACCCPASSPYYSHAEVDYCYM